MRQVGYFSISIIFCLMLCTGLVAQTLGHEWINFSQRYYKLPVTTEGVHRVSQPVLAAAGIPVSTIDPRNFQVFFRGQEIPIFVSGTVDGSFDPNDFIEFVGIRNDGWLDTTLYANPDWHPHRNQSLFSNTSYYFLTWNSQINNKRFKLETDTTLAPHPVSSHYFYELFFNPNYNLYYTGNNYSGGVANSEYEPGAGLTSVVTNASTVTPSWNSAPFTNTRTSLYTPENGTLELRVVSASNPNAFTRDHLREIRVGTQVLTVDTLEGYTFKKYVYAVSGAALSAATSGPVTVAYLNTFSTQTRNGLSEVRAVLPQTYVMGGRQKQFLNIPASGPGKTGLILQSFNNAGGVVWLYDLTGNHRIPMQPAGAGGRYRGVLPNGTQSRRCYLSAESQAVTITTVLPVGTDGQFFNIRDQYRDYDYLIVTHNNLLASARRYANFRSLTGYQPLVVNVADLYDLFAYGIQGHPIAIKRLLEFTRQQWTIKPEHLFIIGKGISNNLRYFNTSVLDPRNLVPGFGVPPTDNLYGYRLLGQPGQQVAIGRLAVENDAQVDAYLRKMQTYETNSADYWMKNILHMGGGKTLAEQQLLAFYLSNFSTHAQGVRLGGFVHTFLKNTSAPIQIGVVDSVRKLINEEGVSLITIFGHGSGQGFDQNIDDPANYLNQGKYFTLIANSCLSGDIFNPEYLVSERFVLEPEKAAVGFIASGSPGISSLLNIYTDTLYRRFSRDNFGRTLGESMRRTITANTTASASNLLQITTFQMQLHGDPAIRFRIPTQPDLFIRSSFVNLQADITTEQDSFQVQARIGNLGAKPLDSVTVSFRWRRANGTDTTAVDVLPAIGFTDTARVWFRMRPTDVGNQFLDISVDPINQIAEVSESNNFISLAFRISSSDLIPVYPRQYGVIPQSRPVVRASTGDPFAPVRSYRLWMDTVKTFSSSFLRDTIIQSSGGVISWSPAITLPDSQVVYWRTGIDSMQTGNFYRFRTASFQYIANRTGWGQARFAQITDNNLLYLEADTPTTSFSFSPVRKKLGCKVLGCMGPLTYTNTLYTIDGTIQEDNGCQVTPGIYVAVINPITLEPWETGFGSINQQNNFGNANHNACKPRPEKYFIYWLNTPNQRDGLQLLLDAVPNDYYVLAYTYNNNVFNTPGNWPDPLIQRFENLGADTLRTLATNGIGRPYIFFAKKGDPSTAIEIVGNTPCDYIEMETDLVTDWVYGSYSSPRIGPSTQWRSLTWQTTALETVPEDSTFLQVFGIKANGQQDLLIPALPKGVQIFNTLNDTISAATYPYLRLSAFTRNDQTLKPAQLKQWHVLFDNVPELALNPARFFQFQSDSLSQGDPFSMAIAIENIGDQPADSCNIRYQILDRNNQTTLIDHRGANTLPGQFFVDSIALNSMNYPGANQIRIDVNNPALPGAFGEITLLNNVAERRFIVGTDRINPLLEVTFDGLPIMDGDLVSAKPVIMVRLTDDNNLLPLNDTADYELYLRPPGSSTLRRIYMGSPEVTFSPANGNLNRAEIEYRPDFTGLDGKYEFMARARDRSGNRSGKGDGDYDYIIRFEVVNQSTITELINYPNPFSTSTRFVFTLTGSVLPDELTIRIMTTSGVVVREITMDELGPIRIGKNITEFAWDGTDEFGDKLATGVYIYKVEARMGGADIDRRATSIDRYFKAGFGKLYILR